MRGRLTQLSFLGATGPYREMVDRFEVNVAGCLWHIRLIPVVTKTLGMDDQVVEDWKIAAYDGTNLYRLDSYERAAQTLAVLREGKLIQPQNVGTATIQTGPVPQALDMRLEILWLAFASHCYFQTLSNGWIQPFFSTFHDLEFYTQDHLVRGMWEMLPHPPGRQVQVVQLPAESLADKDIAQRLGITENTVGSYLKEIFRRCRVHCRVELLARWLGERTRSGPPTNVGIVESDLRR